MAINLTTNVPDLEPLCKRIHLLLEGLVKADLSLHVVAAHPNTDGKETGGATYNKATKNLEIDITMTLARSLDEQDAVVLHEVSHALVDAWESDRSIEIGIPRELVETLSGEFVADWFACRCGREAAIVRIREDRDESYRCCLRMWRNCQEFQSCVQRYFTRRIMAS
jgi:hypothetical protein